MVSMCDTTEVFDAIQKAKAGATGFCTNFFPVQRKLQDWIGNDDLLGEFSNGAAVFLRKDRDFWHLYFSAADAEALRRTISTSPMLRKERIVTDLVGDESALGGLLALFESVGFRRYNRLYRMLFLPQATSTADGASSAQIEFAERADSQTILDLLDKSFDPYAEQLPMLYEIETATNSGQVIAARCDGKLAGFLWFETQGFTSTVRYWLVTAPYRGQRFGAALMHRYFAAHSTVRRFILWVIADNETAIAKYRHYGFAPDGLVDHVLTNPMIRP